MGIFGFLAMLSNTFFIDNENKTKIIEYNHLIQRKLFFSLLIFEIGI